MGFYLFVCQVANEPPEDKKSLFANFVFMPYAIKGNTVVKKVTGKVVGHSKNPKKYLKTLQAVEHGFVPKKKKK